MKCRTCGKEAGIDKLGRQRKYCCLECRYKYQNEKARLKVPRLYPNCIWCGKELEKNQRKYCSQKCKEEKLNKDKLVLKTKKCKYCGTLCEDGYCGALHKLWDNCYVAYENNKLKLIGREQ